MDIETIISAIIAVVILLRLWFVLGRRNNEDVERPNPFIAPAPRVQNNDSDQGLQSKDGMVQVLPPALRSFGLPPASLAGRLEAIRKLDSSFDEKKFLQGARAAFVMIIENFAKNDLTKIECLLGPKVLPLFQASIAARQQAGQTMESQVIRIDEADISAARVEGNLAVITVQFVSEQKNVLRDAGGHIIGGADNALSKVTDIWVFTRDVASTDPNWILTDTHG